ncbi:MAG: DUF1217 domain-containing protein [Roseinatronobacter sp.]
MSFQPTLPLTGLAGWSILTKTRANQESVFSATAAQANLMERFERDFPNISSVDELLKNNVALRVALGAFGLQDDLPNKGFIRRVIMDGTENPSALANRLTDKRYFGLAKALEHLGPSGTGMPSKAMTQDLKKKFLSRSFEIAVGEKNSDYRLAMAFENELGSVLNNFTSDRARWFAILGNPPLRKVLQTALGLPQQIGKIPLEQQSKVLQSALKKRFGISNVGEMDNRKIIEKITNRFIVLSDIQTAKTATSPIVELFRRP